MNDENNLGPNYNDVNSPWKFSNPSNKNSEKAGSISNSQEPKGFSLSWGEEDTSQR